MGLDVSHECWRGAYSAFARWRDKLEEVAGYESAMIQDENGFMNKTVLIDWGHITEDNLQGHWKESPKDPLMILIAHSDCSGIIKTNDCLALMKRLKELINKLPDEDGGGHIGNWKTKTQLFINGLKTASEAGEDVKFF